MPNLITVEMRDCDWCTTKVMLIVVLCQSDVILIIICHLNCCEIEKLCFTLHYSYIYIFYIVTGMHRRGKLATAPVSEAATREGRRCLRIEPRPVFFFCCFTIRANVSRFAPIWAESDRIGRISVCFGRKKKIGR